MKILQNNIQSLNTSLQLLHKAIQSLQIDVVLLQEIWHPTKLNIYNYSQPITKIRQQGEGGGVAIFTSKNVKCVHLKQYDKDGLEAVWAEVMQGKVRMVIGSVYIAPGDLNAITLLDEVIGKIKNTYDSLLIGMDANSRNILWDDSCVGVSRYHRSVTMGSLLEDIIHKHELQIHNNGKPTYISGNVRTAPDVTVTAGLIQFGQVKWSIVDDDLRTPHESILVCVGEKQEPLRKEVVDWKQFDWNHYQETTGKKLLELHEKWLSVPDLQVEQMSDELIEVIQLAVNDIASWKTITQHSRPWISPEISKQLKLLRYWKKKCRLRRSRANIKEYRRVQQETITEIKRAEHEWWLSECSKLVDAGEADKWKIIQRLTNYSVSVGVQPIRKLDQGKEVYLFDDEDIRRELEDYHIRKASDVKCIDQRDTELEKLVYEMAEAAKCTSDNSIMNAAISDNEISHTFKSGSDTPGPDNISASLIDKADRGQMHNCLKVLWNKAWNMGLFLIDWKKENRVIIPKPGKEHYNDCNSYRTVSITSCIGKRFEHITSQRFISYLERINFDSDQFAYLRNRSTTQALLTLVEAVKKSLIYDDKVGVVFYDFSDAFGNVDRNSLLSKIGKDFGVTGKLFLHIKSFLCDRHARLKMNGTVGEWIESIFGTSAGTSLGPLLFITHIHDLPKCIKPKFADDVVAYAAGKDLQYITDELQQATDQLQEWATKEGMPLNVDKTKVMVFGNNQDYVEIKINDTVIENISEQKYLGVVLDHQLNFSLQVQHAVGKAKRAFGKVSMLMDGRTGVPIEIAINLYKTLIRPHLEYGLPAWASVSDSEVELLEKVQSNCLRRLTGAKAHTSTSAIEVMCGVTPFRLRKRELCCREYLRINSKDNGHPLVQALADSVRKGLRFSPLQYLQVMSRELQKAMGDCKVSRCSITSIRESVSMQNVTACTSLEEDCADIDHCASAEVLIYDDEKVKRFVAQHKGSHLLIFTDGSVYSGPVGSGACAAVLFPVFENNDIQVETEAVGTKVNITTCEINAILLGLEMAIKYYSSVHSRKSSETVYLFCDSVNAVKAVLGVSNVNRLHNSFGKCNTVQHQLQQLSVFVKLVTIPGHSGIFGNELADKKAKEIAQKINTGIITAPCEISVNDARKLATDITYKSWQRKWDEDNTGRYTYNLIPKVGTKVTFPTDRSIGISYCRLLSHDTMLNEDSYRTGTSPTALCECGYENESSEHFLFRCSRYDQLRHVMMETVLEFVNNDNDKHCITESMLLAPLGDGSISKKDDYFIKDALFQYLSSVNRNL